MPYDLTSPAIRAGTLRAAVRVDGRNDLPVLPSKKVKFWWKDDYGNDFAATYSSTAARLALLLLDRPVLVSSHMSLPHFARVLRGTSDVPTGFPLQTLTYYGDHGSFGVYALDRPVSTAHPPRGRS